MTGRRRLAAAAGITVLVCFAALAVPWSRHRLVHWEEVLFMGKRTTAERLAEFGEPVAARLRPAFARAGVAYPPAAVTLLGFKDERRLAVFACDQQPAVWRWIADYPVLAASGGPGPKLREGDGQVPEGIYRVESLNPNSLYHLALRVGYPNADDLARGRADGRVRLGGDIMIHGANASVGCLAMGDRAAEDLFVLAALTGVEQVGVVIVPTDLRLRPAPVGRETPAWLPELYRQLATALAGFPAGGGVSAAASTPASTPAPRSEPPAR